MLVCEVRPIVDPNKKWDVKEEAERHAIDVTNAKPGWFCPLIRQNCNGDCVCFSKAKVIHLDTYYKILKPECTNDMFWGRGKQD